MGKKIFFVLVAIPAIIIFIIFATRGTPKKSTSAPYKTQVEQRKEEEKIEEKVSTPETEVKIVPSITGAKIIEPTPEEKRSGEQLIALRNKTPITTDAFTISRFSYKKFKFTVTFNSGFTGNKLESLNTWLIKNNYESIEHKYFEIL